MADFARDELILNDTESSHRGEGVDGLDEILSDDAHSGIIKQYYSKQRKFSEAELQEMRDGIKEICMNDFSDEYNLSDEEKFENAEQAKIFNAVARTKRKCNNIADFIIAVRYRLDAIRYIAEHNGIYPTEKFLKLVAKGKIVLPGLSVPKYTGKNRKKINWDYISEFIADRSKDPSEFRETKESDDFYDFAHADNGRNLFSAYDYAALVEGGSSDESVEIEMLTASDKTMRKLAKHNPNISDSIFKYVSSLKKAKEQSFIFDSSQASIELDSIQVLDQRSIRATKTAPPVFTGSITSDKDWQKYQRDYYDWYVHNVYVEDGVGGRVTIEEYQQAEMRRMLEEAGWNVRKFASNAKYFKRAKRAEKKAKHKAKRVKDNLLASNAYGTSDKKGKKKKNSAKIIDDMKKRQEHDLLNLTGGNYGDFEDYVADMESVDYSSIMGTGRK